LLDAKYNEHQQINIQRILLEEVREFIWLLAKKEELSESSQALNGKALKGRWATAFSLFSSLIRLTFVGYPLHSYQLVTCSENIRECGYTV
jgi:hypothetical protein